MLGTERATASSDLPQWPIDLRPRADPHPLAGAKPSRQCRRRRTPHILFKCDAPSGEKPIASAAHGSCRARSRKWRLLMRESRDMGLNRSPVFRRTFFPSVSYLTHVDRSVELLCRTYRVGCPSGKCRSISLGSSIPIGPLWRFETATLVENEVELRQRSPRGLRIRGGEWSV